ncbi:MAG: hypothetical protein ACK5NM_12795 [Cyclobacteriaceae bacterium]
MVDIFVLVEATKTFQKKPKPLYYSEKKERFARFARTYPSTKLVVRVEYQKVHFGSTSQL